MGDNGQWDADLFRREGHRMVEWIADYLDGGAREMPVLAQVEPGDIAAQIPTAMPEKAEDPEAIWQDFQNITAYTLLVIHTAQCCILKAKT